VTRAASRTYTRKTSSVAETKGENLVRKRLIDRIIDNNTGRIYTDSELLDNKTEYEIFLLRRELQIDLSINTPKYACAYCKSRLYLRGTKRKIIHFYHAKRNPNCPLKAYPQWSLDELRAYIYRGTKEGPLHKKIKDRLSFALEHDSRFKDIKIEKTISDGKSWRKPDVRARFNGGMRVFEIQISNTFLSVIVARELFYRDRDIPLIWIFGEFNKEDTQFFKN
jgi:competence CoiA-like predicted nuclease